MGLERIIEINTNNRHLSLERGFMKVEEKGEIIIKIPLNDIAAVIVSAQGITYSNSLLVSLSERGAIMVFCGKNYTPAAFLWSVDGNFRQAARIEAQINATKPMGKGLWKQIIQAKILQQAAVLKALNKPFMPVKSLSHQVRSGDPSNIEAQAAKRYWQLLFGNEFRRNKELGGINSLLNYGYTIIRSATARAIMGAGLHPSLGVHHANAGNAMRLVDDLIEPFRPFVDISVYHLQAQRKEEVNPETKKVLASVLEVASFSHKGVTPLRNAINNAATSLAMIYEGLAESLEFPSFKIELSSAILCPV
jgi:CRISP-associated protein Cas1